MDSSNSLAFRLLNQTLSLSRDRYTVSEFKYLGTLLTSAFSILKYLLLMKVKSAKELRNFIVKKTESETDLKNTKYDPNFLGCKNENQNKHGFFKLYHGNKKNVKDFLSTILRIAEDGQAIYEFIQNAADCKSDLFYISYNAKYFLAVNNGLPFTTKDINSILNISQSSKFDCEKIGRFGIGFKLVHRLVGKNEGIKELVDNYKGPVLFSWSKPEHLESLLNTNSANEIEYDRDLGSDVPWLFKILITNFPTSPNEIVKDLEYRNNILFPESEFKELVQFLKQTQIHQYLNRLNRGSLFFLKLGEEKSQVLDEHQKDFDKGVQCSLNMLKTLKTVVIGNEQPIEKLNLKTLNFIISPNMEAFKSIEPEYDKCDIKITFGYLPYQESNTLKEYSNFYKYFPMGDEAHGFRFIIHCDAFNINASRRELQESTTNKEIFKWFVPQLEQQLEEYRLNDLNTYREIYANFLLSDEPKPSKQWLNKFLYQPILEYCQRHIPTKQGNFYTREQVRVKGTKLDITPADFGIEDIDWFYWHGRKSQLVDAAKTESKLHLKEWRIEHLLQTGNPQVINQWISQADPENYNLFLNELNRIQQWQSLIDIFYSLKIFKFTNGNYYSISEIKKNSDFLLLSSKLVNIKNDVWQKLNFIISEVNISKYSNLESQIYNKLPEQFIETNLFERIAKRTSNNDIVSSLTAKGKQMLFQFLSKLEGIGDAKLKRLILFKNQNQKLTPLEKLLKLKPNLPIWLQTYQIDTKEYFIPLNKYCLKKEDVYDQIIYPEWDKIIRQINSNHNISKFYESVKKYFDLSINKASLQDKAYIFTQDGCKHNKEVFYSNNLEKVDSYKKLESVIKDITDRYLPEKYILDYLSQPPFQTESKLLQKCIDTDSLELELHEIKTLMQFLNNNREAPFTYLCISETQESDKYLVSFEKELYQYYSEQEELNNYIQQHLSQTYIKLPVELYDKKGNHEGLLQREDLYNELLDEHDFTKNIHEQLILVVKKCKFSEIQLKFLQKIPNFTLVQGEKYQESSYEYQILELASQLLIENSELLKAFREKITIRDREHNCYRLRAIAVNNEVIFKFTDNIYKIKLSEILPESEKEAIIIDEIITHFDPSISCMKELLGVESSKDIDEIYEELVEHYQTLNNASQLAFVFLYAKEKEDIEFLSDFSIINILNTSINLKNHTFYQDSFLYLYCQKYNFIDLESILNQNYREIAKLLKLDFNNSFAITHNLTWIYEPYFDTEGMFYYYPLKQELHQDTELQKNLFSLMYEKWLQQKPQKISITETHGVDGDETTIIYNNDNLENAIGFVPQCCVYFNRYALEEEKLPEWIQSWIDKTSIDEKKFKQKFLTALGVNTQNTDIVKLRDSLQENQYFRDWSSIWEKAKLLTNTLYWLKDNNFTINDREKVTLNTIKKIYENIQDLSEEQNNLPLLVVKSVEEKTTNYEFAIHNDSKIYSYNNSVINELSECQLKLKDIFNIIQKKQYLLIDTALYSDSLLNHVCPTITEITDDEVFHIGLNIDLLSSESIELDYDYYINWKFEIDNRFIIKSYLGKIPYFIKFANETIFNFEDDDIAIDDAEKTIKKIYINSSFKECLDKKLEELINYSSFTFDDLEKFKKSKKKEPKQIKDSLSTIQDKIDPLGKPDFEIKCLSNDFSKTRYDRDFATFTSELLNQLKGQNSEWVGYLYHFTHIENAVSILNQGSLLPRGKLADFKDSAGSNLINRTSDEIKDFARFYFRPLTPTQWHNELLGRRAGDIKAICPVPIFFCFKIEDVLRTHGAKCGVSNGNLSTNWACYGNSANFLNYFDFCNVYNKFGQANYKDASQQEFIIKDGLNFLNKNIDFKIICRNEQDKRALLKLINNPQYKHKVEINSSFYNNDNAYVKVDKYQNQIKVSLGNDTSKINGLICLSLESKNIKIQSSKDIMLELNNCSSFKVSFIEDNKKWLILEES